MARNHTFKTGGELIKSQQRFFAKMCASSSTLRNQGSKDMVETAQRFLTDLDLATLGGCTIQKYRSTLNRWTNKLATRFPCRGKGNWGAARKAHNIFFFHCTMNVQFVQAYDIGHMREFQEVTLDNLMIKYLKRQARYLGLERDALVEWRNIKTLARPLSDRIQVVAQKVADNNGCNRCDLDFFAWPAAQRKRS